MYQVDETRRAPGVVRDAIITHLKEVGSSNTSATTAAVSEALGEPVAASSVRSYLRLNTPRLFARVGRGTYRLRAE